MNTKDMSSSHMTVSQEYIKSGEYFRDSLIWYNEKFLAPVVERSLIISITILLVILGITISINIRSQFPLSPDIKYLSYVKGDVFSKNILITEANQMGDDAGKSINFLLCKNYIIKRESYDYSKLEDQLIYVKQNSTKVLFKSFYDSLALENPYSPLLKYQRYARRSVIVDKIDFVDSNNVFAYFRTEATDMDGKVFERLNFQVKISFGSSNLDDNTKPGSDYKFLVTEYRLEKQQDKEKDN